MVNLRDATYFIHIKFYYKNWNVQCFWHEKKVTENLRNILIHVILLFMVFFFKLNFHQIKDLGSYLSTKKNCHFISIVFYCICFIIVVINISYQIFHCEFSKCWKTSMTNLIFWFSILVLRVVHIYSSKKVSAFVFFKLNVMLIIMNIFMKIYIKFEFH